MNRPGKLGRADFIAHFGGVFEHSSWIAERAFDQLLPADCDSAAGLHGALCGVFRVASRVERLGVLRAHPDLAGRLALAGDLTDDSIMEQSLEQFGPGFGEVIIDQRNQVVIDDLKALLEREPDLESVAILYGAAHMRDLGERLADQLGYRSDDERWITAFEVDMADSAVSPEQLRQLRHMVRQAMRLGRSLWRAASMAARIASWS